MMKLPLSGFNLMTLLQWGRTNKGWLSPASLPLARWARSCFALPAFGAVSRNLKTSRDFAGDEEETTAHNLGPVDQNKGKSIFSVNLTSTESE